MGWQTSSKETEKMKFIRDLSKREQSFKVLCERYHISRKTGYKLVKRFWEEGKAAFEERSRARHHHPNGLTPEILARLTALKYRFPTWGPKKLKDWLERNEPEMHWPASSTIGEHLKKQGLVKARKSRRKVPAHGHPFLNCDKPNRVWSADFKGQFKLGTGQYCYPLTVTDNYSRFLLGCQGLLSPNLHETYKQFKKLFQLYGLPDAIRTDNGQPFAGVGIGGLTRLSIWWLKLGIVPERIALGHPEQNGRHERMHRTLKEATTQPAQDTLNKQQRAFNDFIKDYNFERSHEGIDRKRPVELYKRSHRDYPKKLSECDYPNDYLIRKVRSNGEIKWKGKKYFVSELLHRETIGLEPIDEGRAIVYFSTLKLGLIDVRLNKITRPA